MEFVLNVSGLYICFISSSVIQEKIYDYRSDDGNKFESATLLAFSKNVMAFLLARALLCAKGQERKPVSGTAAFWSAAIRLLGTIFSLYALDFISYPHLLIARCLKILPIFISDVLFTNKPTRPKRCFSVVLTTMGVCIYSYEDVIGTGSNDTNGSNDNLFGILFIVLSLCMDGALSVAQTNMLSDNSNSITSEKQCSTETMLFMSMWQSLFSFSILLFSFGEEGGFRFCLENPIVFAMILLCSTLDSLGQFFIYRFLVNNGTYTTSFVTTMRKFVTILLLIIVFRHVLSSIKWVGFSTVIVGACIDLVPRKHKTSESDSDSDYVQTGYVQVPTVEFNDKLLGDYKLCVVNV